MPTSTIHHSQHHSKLEKILRPRNMLDVLFGTVAACLVVGILTFSAIAKPYQQPQDLRQQAAADPLPPIPRCDRLDSAMSDECRVLNNFYNATNGDSWVYPANSIHWFANPIICSWSGIKCENGRVTAIQLPGYKVSGTLPNNLSELTSLRYLVLYNNDISGTIPSDLGKIKLLEQLDLSQNAFSGPVPTAFGELSQLTLLNISRTRLSGALPLSLTRLHNLQEFVFNATQLCIPTDKAFITFLQNIPNMVGTNRYCPSLTTAPVTPTPAPNATTTPRPTSPANSPTPSPTPVKNCNQICTNNAQCGINMRCYQVGSEYKCRLAANPDNDSCQLPPDNGLQRSCNEYCSDTSECQSDLLCWYNRCRRPDNSESTSCALPSQAVLADMRASCNTSCTSNRDCAVNLRCYQGSCRLATNPSSSSCRPAPRPPTATETKGGLGSVTVTPTGATSTTSSGTSSSSSATKTATASDSADSSNASLAASLITPTLGTEPTMAPSQDSKGLFSGIATFFKSLTTPEQVNTRRMLLAILAVGLILIGVAFVINALTKSKSKPPKNPPVSGGVASGDPQQKSSPSPTTRSPSETVAGSETVPPSTLTATLPGAAATTETSAVVTKDSTTVASPTTSPSSTTPTNAAPAHVSSAPLYPSGGMTARLKQKGVTAPS